MNLDLVSVFIIPALIGAAASPFLAQAVFEGAWLRASVILSCVILAGGMSPIVFGPG